MSEKHYQCEPNAACEHGHQMKHFSMPNSAEAVARGLVNKIMPYGWDDGGETKPLFISEITVALTTYAAAQVEEPGAAHRHEGLAVSQSMVREAEARVWAEAITEVELVKLVHAENESMEVGFICAKNSCLANLRRRAQEGADERLA